MLHDGRRGMRIARALIALAIVYGLLVLFMWVAQPGFMGPMFSPWYETALPLPGLASYLFGLAAMVRIYRANSESGDRSWRYRDF